MPTMTSGEKFGAKQDSGLLRFSLGIMGSSPRRYPQSLVMLDCNNV